MNVRHVVLALVATIGVPVAAQTPQPAMVANDFVAPAPGQAFDEPLAHALSAISASSIRAHIEFLASPAMEGRGLGTRGLDAAAEYAAATLKLAGLAPYGASDSYFQLVPLRQMKETTGQLEIERHDGPSLISRTFTAGIDFVPSPQPPQSLKAPVVFAGFGIQEPQLGRDDYAGLDVNGRVVMILAGVPPGPAWQKPEMQTRYAADAVRERFAAKLETARRLGAVAVLAVEDERLATGMAKSLDDEAREFRAWDAKHEPPLLRVSRSVASAVIGESALAQAISGAAKTSQPAATASITIGGKETLLVSRNILAILPGSDPALRDEAVVIGAHIDHLGIPGGVLHPGADDNASGTSALLEMARVFASAPQKPRRTIVFAFWTGEEEGHFGSEFYVMHPRWPLAHMTAYLNLDMIGHPWLMSEIRKLVEDQKLPDGERFLSGIKAETFVEPGLPPDAPVLEQALRDSARGNGLTMHLDHTSGTSGGSDYRAFAREHIPFIRFFGNFFPDYHEPGDTPDKLDATQVQRVARFAFATAWELANR